MPLGNEARDFNPSNKRRILIGKHRELLPPFYSVPSHCVKF